MKQITAREFQKRFGRLTRELAEGQSVQVTRHGTPVGVFTKTVQRRTKTPDFEANLKITGCSPKLGDKILEEFGFCIPRSRRRRAQLSIPKGFRP
jgi:antitoxin (DNA-binding transcriptional repressor) of toxin-antitoxin stability system